MVGGVDYRALAGLVEGQLSTIPRTRVKTGE